MRDGSRGVTHITDVTGIDANGNYTLCDLFLRSGHDQSGGSTLAPTGNMPRCIEAIHSCGSRLPEAMYAAALHRHESRDVPTQPQPRASGVP